MVTDNVADIYGMVRVQADYILVTVKIGSCEEFSSVEEVVLKLFLMPIVS